MITKELAKALRDCTKECISINTLDIMLEAANAIEGLYQENKKLHNDLIMQQALAQNGQSAIETNKLINKKLQIAMNDIKTLASQTGDICSYCKHYQPCEKEQCIHYIEGVGATDEKGKYLDWKWTCMDWNYGTCNKLENTPCNGCMDNDDNGFEWKSDINE